MLHDAIQKLAPIVQDLVRFWIANVLPTLEDVANILVGKLIPFALQVADVLIRVLRPAFDVAVVIIRDVFIPILKATDLVLLGLMDASYKAIGGVIDAIHGVGAAAGWFKQQFTDAKDWVVDQFNKVTSFVSGIPGKMAAAGAGMWDWVSASFKSAINTVIGWWDALRFPLPKVHIWGVGDVGGGEVGVPYISPLATGGLVMPTPGGTVVRVAEAGQPEIVSPIPMMEEAVSRALARSPRPTGRDAQLIGTVNTPQGLSADGIAELLYGKLTARGVAV